MAVVTRQLVRSDMEAAAVVLRRSFDERLPRIAGLHTFEEDRGFFETVVFERCGVWGSLEGPHLLGFIALRGSHIEHLYVLPGRQGRGIGTVLLSLALARCAGLDFWTFHRNEAARRFYERRGFVAVETTDGTRNEEREPDVRYGWRAS